MLGDTDNAFSRFLQSIGLGVLAGTIPIYNVNGDRIGHFESLNRACSGPGYFFFTPGFETTPVNQIYVSQGLNLPGNLIPFGQYCVSQGLQPGWLTAEQAASYLLPSILNTASGTTSLVQSMDLGDETNTGDSLPEINLPLAIGLFAGSALLLAFTGTKRK